MSDEQSNIQKKIAFAQSDHIAIVISLLRECAQQQKLVGETEYATVVNAVTMDAQSDMIIKFISSIDFIRKGGLINKQQ